jgi:glycosyltransferase involved in cell wall biosynthesis
MSTEPITAKTVRISAVGVVVPARDEEERIGRCLHSVRRALASLPRGVATALAVVLDRCSDDTPERVTALVANWPEALVVPVTAGSSVRATGRGVGALRDLGLRHVLARLAAHPPAGTWLLSTDADTSVPADWALAHLRCAAAGAHAVAGLADLATSERLAADALMRYRAIVDDGLRGATHHHVYGANLGVRADAYLAGGGFPRDGAGEDHGLWRRLRAAGHTLAQPVGLRVQTSARLHGRAEGGLAHLLRTLHDAVGGERRSFSHQDGGATGS